jgi:hypothetical protein
MVLDSFTMLDFHGLRCVFDRLNRKLRQFRAVAEVVLTNNSISKCSSSRSNNEPDHRVLQHPALLRAARIAIGTMRLHPHRQDQEAASASDGRGHLHLLRRPVTSLKVKVALE